MSVFPFKCEGSAISYKEARDLAGKLYAWHSQNKASVINVEPADQASFMHRVALGIMTTLTEPSMIIFLGHIGNSVDTDIQISKNADPSDMDKSTLSCWMSSMSYLKDQGL